MLNIITTDEKFLRERLDDTDYATNKEAIKDTIIAMKQRMIKDNLTHLSANQIGGKHRIVCIAMKDDIMSMINPIIYIAKGMKISFEKCINIKDKRYMLPRATDISVAFLDENGEEKNERFFGLASILIQHAIEHLDGIMIDDFGLEVDDEFDKSTDKEKGELIAKYVEIISNRKKEIDNEIESDEELKKFNESIERERKNATHDSDKEKKE